MSAEAPPPRVVAVDDERLNRELVRDALRTARVECCDSGEAALEALAREPAELVISDLTMPGISGLELLERVRREHPGTEFILLTANASVESAVEALRRGAADYLVKPVRGEELLLVVERILGRRRLLEENERLREALRAVESCQNLVRCLDASEIYVIALDLMLAQLPRQRGLALFHRTSVPMADAAALRGFGEAEAELLHEVLVIGKRVNLDAVTEMRSDSQGQLQQVLRGAGIEFGRTLTIPVRGRETEAGVIWLLEDGRPFSSGEIERARFIAGHAALALQNAERYNRAKERAFIDDVTEVFNARYLLQAAEREIQRAERYGKPLSVLFLDLDRFKLVNDRFGHLVGSQALRRLSQVLGDCIRQVDTLARYGGDEFTILLVDTGLESALAISERIRTTVSETLFEAGADTPFHLTLSVGVASYPQHGRERDTLLDVADKAMYRAKSRGRNCVCSADDLGDD